MNKLKKIFIVEDEIKIRKELSIFLEKNGFTCIIPNNFKTIIDEILENESDLVLLDINLPFFDGYYICKEIRKKSDIPIIVVTSRDTEMDELIAINTGADDFISKPYNTMILLARINSLLKRSSNSKLTDKIECGEFNINLSQSIIVYKNNKIDLTKNEIKILTILYENKGNIVSRDELMENLWNSNMFIDDNTLTVNINRLRKKLQNFGIKSFIETKRGRGYIVY
jgi:DNA-binding response OmpR family regulator